MVHGMSGREPTENTATTDTTKLRRTRARVWWAKPSRSLLLFSQNTLAKRPCTVHYHGSAMDALRQNTLDIIPGTRKSRQTMDVGRPCALTPNRSRPWMSAGFGTDALLHWTTRAKRSLAF